MAHSLRKSQSGIAIIMIALVVVLVAGVGGTGYYVLNKNKSGNKSADQSRDASTSPVASTAACTFDDKEVCKFIANAKMLTKYKVTSSSKDADGKTATATFTIDGNNNQLTTDFEGGAWDTITANGEYYVKASNGTWYKQAKTSAQTPQPSNDEVAKSIKEESTALLDDTSLKTTTFTKLGEEACGKLKCLKYKSIDSAHPDDTAIVWFDTKDYRMQKLENTSKDGSSISLVFSYDNVSVKAPANAKELLPNQYLLPGQNEPTTIGG